MFMAGSVITHIFIIIIIQSLSHALPDPDMNIAFFGHSELILPTGQA